MFNKLHNSGPMLVTEPNVVWLLVKVLVAIVFVTTTLASKCLLCQIFPCPRCVLKIHGRSGVDTIQPDLLLTVRLYQWLDCLATQRIEKTRRLTNYKKSFLLKRVWETINNKRTMFSFLANRRRKNIEKGRVMMRCS